MRVKTSFLLENMIFNYFYLLLQFVFGKVTCLPNINVPTRGILIAVAQSQKVRSNEGVLSRLLDTLSSTLSISLPVTLDTIFETDLSNCKKIMQGNF